MRGLRGSSGRGAQRCARSILTPAFFRRVLALWCSLVLLLALGLSLLRMVVTRLTMLVRLALLRLSLLLRLRRTILLLRSIVFHRRFFLVVCRLVLLL